jgi:hypothetical protein
MDIEENLCCPIGFQLFYDPVTAEDGHTYEKTHILTWFKQSNISPMTNKPIGTSLVPSYIIKNLVDSYLKKNPTKLTDRYKPNLTLTQFLSEEKFGSIEELTDIIPAEEFLKLYDSKDDKLKKILGDDRPICRTIISRIDSFEKTDHSDWTVLNCIINVSPPSLVIYALSLDKPVDLNHTARMVNTSSSINIFGHALRRYDDTSNVIMVMLQHRSRPIIKIDYLNTHALVTHCKFLTQYAYEHDRSLYFQLIEMAVEHPDKININFREPIDIKEYPIDVVCRLIKKMNDAGPLIDIIIENKSILTTIANDHTLFNVIAAKLCKYLIKRL